MADRRTRRGARPPVAIGPRLRYALAACASLGVAAAYVGLSARRLGGPVLTAPNVLTMSRAAAAAMACGTAAQLAALLAPPRPRG